MQMQHKYLKNTFNIAISDKNENVPTVPHSSLLKIGVPISSIIFK